MPTLEERVEKLERVLPDAVLNLIQSDPHQWSERPCPTCAGVSAMIGRPFGCDEYRARRAANRRQ